VRKVKSLGREGGRFRSNVQLDNLVLISRTVTPVGDSKGSKVRGNESICVSIRVGVNRAYPPKHELLGMDQSSPLLAWRNGGLAQGLAGASQRGVVFQEANDESWTRT